MKAVKNPHRDGAKLAPDAPYPSVAAWRVGELLARCSAAEETPLVSCDTLAREAGIGALWVKDERPRMGLGSFKALGAAYVIARQAADLAENLDRSTLAGRTYVTASAGNHGLSVAAGARIFGARAVVYIAETVPASFAERLSEQGAEVHRIGADYAASLAAACDGARDNNWTLLSDTSWPGYTELPYVLMEGYLQLAAEAVRQCPDIPTHIVLQAGVGGLAGAVAAFARKQWGDDPVIVVVEPQAARALQASIVAGKSVLTEGPASIMGRLDCKEPSLIALNGLGRDADWFVTLSDDEVVGALPAMTGAGLATTASGGAGIALALNPTARETLNIGADARVLAILSEVAE